MLPSLCSPTLPPPRALVFACFLSFSCTHPNDDDLAAALSEKDVMLGMFNYIDRIVTQVCAGVAKPPFIQRWARLTRATGPG